MEGKEDTTWLRKTFFPDKWPDIRFCNKYFHLSKHTHTQSNSGVEEEDIDLRNTR